MIRLGITGEMASGKSFISNIFEAKGVPVYNCDDKSKQLVINNQELVLKIKESFGETIYEGNVYKNLAGIVFTDEEKLKLLTSLIHPYIRADINKFYEDNSSASFCLIESAILYESKMGDLVDRIIYVHVPEEIRIQRAEKRSNLTKEQYIDRMKNQISPTYKIRYSDYIISNYSDFDINGMVEQIYNHLTNYDPAKYVAKKWLDDYFNINFTN